MSEVDPARCYLLRSTVSEAKADDCRRHPHLDVYDSSYR